MSLVAVVSLISGPFAPAVGEAGSTAVSKDDPAISHWADRVVSYEPGEGVDQVWTDTSKALGSSQGTVYEVVSLGQGGKITLHFESGIANGPGYDFVIFGNAFSNFFLELAFVEVSSNGSVFYRFPNTSLTATPVPAFGQVDPTQIDGFAGKYRVGYGTPFDLEILAGSPGLDLSHIRYIRLIDVVGNGSTTDSEGRPIYAPYPTVGSAGFDLEAAGVIHAGFLREVLHDESGQWTLHRHFGWYFGAYYPWLYFAEMGWLYTVPTSADSFWVWSENEGWSWTEAKVYPMRWNETLGWGLF